MSFYLNISCGNILCFSFLGENIFCIVLTFVCWNGLLFAENIVNNWKNVCNISYTWGSKCMSCNSHDLFCIAFLYLGLLLWIYSLYFIYTWYSHYSGEILRYLSNCFWNTALLPLTLISHLLYGILRTFWMSSRQRFWEV